MKTYTYRISIGDTTTRALGLCFSVSINSPKRPTAFEVKEFVIHQAGEQVELDDYAIMESGTRTTHAVLFLNIANHDQIEIVEGEVRAPKKSAKAKK